MRELWQELQRELTELVLPADCAGCGLPRVRGQLCGECGSALAGAVPRRVRPSPVPPGLPAVYAATAYADEVRAVLLTHKERGGLRLAAPLGAVLARAVRAAAAAPGQAAGHGARADRPCRGPMALVPVPSARAAVAGRGHDPVRRIAQAAARQLRASGLSAQVLPVLRQRRPVADQSGLTAEQRTVNLSGALEAVRGSRALLEEAGTVLVDDLMTTGASLAEASRAVTAGGGRVTGAAVIASRSRRGRSNLEMSDGTIRDRETSQIIGGENCLNGGTCQ